MVVPPDWSHLDQRIHHRLSAACGVWGSRHVVLHKVSLCDAAVNCCYTCSILVYQKIKSKPCTKTYGAHVQCMYTYYKNSQKLNYILSNLDTTTSIKIFCTTLKHEYNKEVNGNMILKFQDGMDKIHSSWIQIRHIIQYFIVQMLLALDFNPLLLQG